MGAAPDQQSARFPVPPVPALCVDQFRQNLLLRRCLEVVHPPHPLHRVGGFQFLGHSAGFRHLGHHLLDPRLGGLLDLLQVMVQSAAGHQIHVGDFPMLLQIPAAHRCVLPKGNCRLLGREKIRQKIIALLAVCDCCHGRCSFLCAFPYLRL